MRIQKSLEAACRKMSRRIDEQTMCVSHSTRPDCDTSFRLERWIGVALILAYLFLPALTATGQVSGSLYSQAPPPQPTADRPVLEGSLIFGLPATPAQLKIISLPLNWLEMRPPRPELPARVEIPANQRIAVVLDTLLSTRISKIGQAVSFRTPYSILLGDGLEVPPYIEILGHVMQVQRPGRFGKEGVLGIAVDRLQLQPGGGANLEAHLDSKEMKAQGRPMGDRRNPNEPYSIPIDAAGGALMGALIGGAKGAGIGAGAGAAIALLIMAAHRGDDVYLEPGMAFSVILDQPAYLSGDAVYAAQQNYLKNRRSPIPDDPRSVGPENGMPKLKRRRSLPSTLPSN
jgi:hypothetical protein